MVVERKEGLSKNLFFFQLSGVVMSSNSDLHLTRFWKLVKIVASLWCWNCDTILKQFVNLNKNSFFANKYFINKCELAPLLALTWQMCSAFPSTIPKLNNAPLLASSSLRTKSKLLDIMHMGYARGYTFIFNNIYKQKLLIIWKEKINKNSLVKSANNKSCKRLTLTQMAPRSILRQTWSSWTT